MKYPRVFHALRVHGHSGPHAAQIILDASRGDRFSLNWIRRVHSMVPRVAWVTRKQRAGDPIDNLLDNIKKGFRA